MSNSLTLTVAEFDKMVQCGAFEHLNRKIELIRGEIRTMNPAGPIHNDLIAFLVDWSVRSTNRNEIRVTVQAGIDLRALQSQPEPDIAWVRADRYRDKHPSAEDVRLAIEVSDSSLETDLVEKLGLYASAGIIEYWIVDAKSCCIHQFRNPKFGDYSERSIAKVGESIGPLVGCNTPLNLNELFSGE